KVVEKLIGITARQGSRLRTCEPDSLLDVVEGYFAAERSIQLVQTHQVKRRLLPQAQPRQHALDKSRSELRFWTGCLLSFSHDCPIPSVAANRGILDLPAECQEKGPLICRGQFEENGPHKPLSTDRTTHLVGPTLHRHWL